jgi:hypothetical protein
VFAGAVVEKASGRVYVLEFSKEHKGYVLARSFKDEKGAPKLN